MKNTFSFNKSLIQSITFLITLQTIITLQAHSLPNTFTSHYKNVPVLVTGGCGFIGSHLVEKLVELGADVTILDDLSSGNKENIAAVAGQVTFLQGSITDFNTCLIATKNKQIIFHLAAFVSVPESIKKSDACHKINTTGTRNMLEAAHINHVKRFVFSSTCAVYGESISECNETMRPAPSSPYGFSKLMGELYCNEYEQLFNIEVAIMRYFNVYGPRQNPHGSYAGIIAKFTHNIEHNLPLTVFGDGTQTRDYVAVYKVINANLLLGMCDKHKINGEIFNIATGNSVTVLELINILKQKYPHYQEDNIIKPARPGDVKHISANCLKYNNLYNQICMLYSQPQGATE
jgi:nucleoside-diphosphate-sugar epimerase